MNEQIKKITGQVLDELVPETWTALGYDKIKEIQNRTAELIVRECADVCLAQRDPANLNYKPSERFAEAVKQHFGVQ